MSKKRNKQVVSSQVCIDERGDRVLAVTEFLKSGQVQVRTGRKLSGGDKERVAAWFSDILDIDHECAYEFLFLGGDSL